MGYNQGVFAEYQKTTWKLIQGDNLVNWVLGLALILVPDLFNRFLFGHELISHWIFIVLGAGFIWFAAWQVNTFLKPRQLEKPALRFAALMAWGPVMGLTLFLLTMVERFQLFALIVLGVADLYMLLLGIWYWWVGQQLA